MLKHIYDYLLYVMPVLAVIVFIALFKVKAGYGIFRSRGWGISIPNKMGWVIMECPAFIVMLLMWLLCNDKTNVVLLTFFMLFELHYFQRTFIFPFLMKGHSMMPVSIVVMGMIFNIINAFLIGESLFYLASDYRYTDEWLTSPLFICGVIIFFAGMIINIHSDSVIRNLRPKGDTKHYLPQKGMYRYVTSANYFGELTEWVGFAVLTQSEASWIFVIWTFANLAPRAHSIRERYRKEFGKEAVGRRKRMIPFIY